MRSIAKLDEQKVSVRVKIAGLWAAMLFVFAYVDIFGFLRADIIKDALNGVSGVFNVNQTFFALTTLYILIPSLMVFLSLILRPRLNRVLNIAIASLYILTIIGASIGEKWAYYLMGSAIEVILLGILIYYCVKWPKKV